MLRDKSDYFKVAEDEGIPKRCLILDRCARRSQTIAIFSDWGFEETRKKIGLRDPVIESIGDGAQKVAGNNNYYFSGLCPEVCLFELSYVYPEFSNVPATAGSYDKFMKPSFELLETGHYSECAEYVNFLHAQSRDKQISKKESFIAREYKWIIATIIGLITIIVSILTL